MSTFGRGAVLLLAVVLVAVVVIWRTAGRSAAQEMGSKTVSGEAPPPSAVPQGTEMSSEEFRRLKEQAEGTPSAVPQGTEMSSEEFRHLKEQAEGTPGSAGSSVQQDPAAGPER
jgi:hypothetical protein